MHGLKSLMLLFVMICATMIAGCAAVNQDSVQSTNAPTAQPTPVVSPTAHQIDLSCIKLGCWADIFPGSTTALEAQSLLVNRYGKDNVNVNQNSIDWQGASSGNHPVSWMLTIDKQGIIDRIDMSFSSGQLTVEELIQEVKEPAYVYVVRAISDEAKCAGAFISYPSVGINVYLSPIASSIGVQPTQFIQSVELLSPQDAATFYVYDTVKLKWEGYKEYCELVE